MYRGFDPRLQREVAIKVLTAAAGADPTKRQRFAAEAEALARFRHPGVVNLHAAGEERGHPYLVMDFVEGESLQERIEREPLSPAAAVELLISLSRSLAAAHAAGILHRDLKPDNVLLRQEDGSPVLIDFGLAKDLSEGAAGPTRSGAIMGTPGFWSPEQARGERSKVGPWTDVHGLGAILYAALTSTPPFEGGSLIEVVIATANRAPDPPSRIVPGVDSALERICLRCLAKKPEDRYPGPAELADALEAWQAGSGRGLGARLRPLAITAALVLLGGGLAFGLQSAFHPTPPAPSRTPSPEVVLPSSPPTTPTPPLQPSQARTSPWSRLPLELPQPKTHDELISWVRQEVAQVEASAPALEVLGRYLRGTRLGEVPPASSRELAASWRRDPRPAPIVFLQAARRGSARSLEELALCYVRSEAGLVYDPLLGERFLIGLCGAGHQLTLPSLGWTYYKDHPPAGLKRQAAEDLAAAAFALAVHFGDPQATAPAAQLAEAHPLPTPSEAWERLRARGEALEASAFAPVSHRGKPFPLTKDLALDLSRQTLAELLTRSPRLFELHERALDEPATPFKGTLVRLLREALRGNSSNLWLLGVEYSQDRSQLLRRVGRVILVDAIRAGSDRGYGPLGESHDQEGERELATACVSLTAEGHLKEQSWLAASGSKAPPPDKAWELLWTGYERDRVGLGLGLEPAPLSLALPKTLRALVRVPDPEREVFLLNQLRLRYPALRVLQREIGHLQLRSLDRAQVLALGESLKQRGDGIGRAGVAAYAARVGGATRLNVLSTALSNRASSVRDLDLGQVLLYTSAASGWRRSWTHVSRSNARAGQSHLHLSALILATLMGDSNAKSRAESILELSSTPPPSRVEALAAHQRQLAQLLARTPPGVQAWPLRRGVAITKEAQRARVRRIARMILIRDHLLTRTWSGLAKSPKATLLRDGAAAEKQRPGLGAGYFIRHAIEEGDPRTLQLLAESLGQPEIPGWVALAWAILYSRLDVENTGDVFLDLAQAARNSNNLTLALALVRLAETDPSFTDQARRLQIAGGATLPSLAEAQRVAGEDRERAFLAAGFPCVGWTPTRRVPERSGR